VIAHLLIPARILLLASMIKDIVHPLKGSGLAGDFFLIRLESDGYRQD
tara:strand:+ start:389 stop:532 length:144 start_codon:yes stop_codon:yes gene_type:complete